MERKKKCFWNPYKIFESLAMRGFFKNMNDKEYLSWLYRARMGRLPDLNHPKSFNEKLQWLKLNDRKPEYTEMVDKYLAKKYVEKRIGEKYIIPTLGVWDEFDQIEFEKLPDQFVLKTTHDSGGVVICKDKANFDKAAAKKKLEKSLKRNYYWAEREWPYKNVKPQIIAEKFMVDKSGDGLIDYKFYCFNGMPEFLYISNGMDNHKTARLSFLTMNWGKAPFGRSDYLEFETIPPRPRKFDEMVQIAKSLSEGHPFLRVDLYEISEQVYFSELTFSPCGGFMPFVPEGWDEKLGDMINIC